jgi:DNA-binding response OmpR family regulator
MNAGAAATAAAVLIVDDDAVCRQFCVSALTGRGYRIFTAEDGESAIRVALRERPAVILTDMHLPGLTGAETLRRLLQAWPEAASQSRFIGLSGDGRPSACAAMRCAGVGAFLAKPFSSRALRERVQDELCRLAGAAPLPAVDPAVRPPAQVAGRVTHEPGRHSLQDIFCAELGPQLSRLDRAISALEWQRAAEILHRQCGAAALAGFPALASNGRLLLGQLHGRPDPARLAERYLDFLEQAEDLSRHRKSRRQAS